MRNLRQKAAGLNVASANTLLQRYLPYLMGKLTAPQLAKLQRVLDAAVVNESIQRQYKDVYRRSIIAKSGGLVMRDPRLMDRADDLADSMVRLTEDDKRIQVSPELALSVDALLPATSNPDEAKYLATVRAVVSLKGVWLRITQPYVKDPNDLSQHILDARQFELWLSLGPDGDHIPSLGGCVTREALLSTTEIGAGYYRQVFGGPVEYALKKLRNQLHAQMETAQEEHFRLLRRRDGSTVGYIADGIGGTDLPPIEIWNRPQQLILKGVTAGTKGNTLANYAYLLGAAMVIRTNAKELSEYVKRSTNGAETATTILTVIAAVGAIAGSIASAYGIASFAAKREMMTMPRWLAQLGAPRGKAARAAAESVDDIAKKALDDYVRKNPGLADDLGNVTVVKGPKGNIGGNMKGGHSSGIGGSSGL